MTTTALTHAPDTTLPTAGDWKTITDMADALVRSGFLPEAVNTPQKAAAIMLKGRELGIPAMQSFGHIHVIKGKPTCSSELMMALLARGGVTWEWTEDGYDGKVAGILFRRKGFKDALGRYTIKEAEKAKLLGKDSWKNYPANMLRARAISNGARMIGPDLLSGMSYTPEEMGAEVNEDSEPLEVEVEVVEPEPEPVDAEVLVQKAKNAYAALRRDFPSEKMEEDVQVLCDSIGIESLAELNNGHSKEMAEALTRLYRVNWDQLCEEVGNAESAVHNAAEHTRNARKKHLGEDKEQVSDWKAKDDLAAVRAYLKHLSEQADEKAAA